jgi:antitoxin component YwqK of YwqJK toxin-antitoxin module
MKIILILLILFIPYTVLTAQQAINQTDSNHLKQGKWIGKYPDGVIRYEGVFINDKPIGEWKRFHENGKLKAKLVYLPNSDKVRAELYDTGGILVSRGNFIGAAKDSIWTYYDNTIIVARESYDKGLKNGISYSYSLGGKVISESAWSNGMLNGISREYYPSGAKKSEVNFLDGKRHGEARVYFESGQVQTEGKYKQDLYADNWKYYNPDGTLKFQLKYQNGILLNPEMVDSLQLKEFKAFDRDKLRLKDPEHYLNNPEEYPGK